MSKYGQLRSILGGVEDFNDKTTKGRVLKWYADSIGAPKEERTAKAVEIMARLKDYGVTGVQKVLVRNVRCSYDKVCVYINNT